MAIKRFDKTEQLAVGVGTAALTFTSATTGNRTYAAAGAEEGDQFWARIQHEALPAEWEICLATIVGGTIVRSTPIQSSTGAAVAFSAGNKIVSDGVPYVRIPTADGDAYPFDGIRPNDYVMVWSVADQAWKTYSAIGVGDRPGYATATTVDGEVLTSSGPLVSPIGRITSVTDDGNGFYKCQSRKKHGLADGDRIVLSADGWHGVTHREHPANSPWESNTEGTVFDVGYWEVEVVDPYWFRVPVAVVANSVFLQGQFWRHDATLIDAQPIYEDLRDRVKEAGGGTIRFPAGHIWSEGQFLVEEGVNIEGAGINATFFVQADRVDQHFFRHVGEGNFFCTDATECCRRHRQDLTLGLHGFRLGDDEDVVTRKAVIRRWRVEAPPGYGVACQGHGAFIDCDFDIEGNASDSDFFDSKNRLNLNAGNRISAKVEHFGLKWIGTNHADYILPTDPFTTVNGSSIVTISHPGQEYNVGIVVTLPNAGIFNGIDLTGSWTILGKTNGGYTIDVSPQVANAGSTGGGSGRIEQAAPFSSGDVCVDLRGAGWSIGVIDCSGDLRSRGVLRHRSGELDDVNGQGAVHSIGGQVFARNTHASRTNAIGAIVGGRGNSIPAVFGQNLNQCVAFLAQSSANSVSQVHAVDCNIGAIMRGNDNGIGILTAETCGTGWVASGSTAIDLDYLEEDACEATIGSSVVKITRLAHGHVNGNTVTLSDIEPGFGVNPNGTNKVITYIDDDHFSVVGSGVADDSGFFGGENGTISWGVLATGKNPMVGMLRTIDCTVGAHIYAGATAAQIGNRSSNGDTLDLIDCGTGTILYPTSSIDSDAFAWASAAITAGGIVKTVELGWISTLIKAEKTSGAWALTGDYRAYGAVADSVASLVSLKRRTTATLIGTPTFVPYRGWKGDGVSSCVNTRTNPSGANSLYTTNNGRSFVVMQDNVQGTMSASGVSSGGSQRIRPRNTSDKISAQMLSSIADTAETVSTSVGYTSVQREGGSTLKVQRDSTIFAAVTPSTTPSSLPNSNVYNLAYNNGGSVSEPHSGTIFGSGLGAPLDDTMAQAQAANYLALMVSAGAA